MKELNNFDSIRPYFDEEVAGVINRLKQDEQLIQTIGQYFHPFLFRCFPSWTKFIVRKMLHQRFKTIHDITSFQEQLIKPVVEQVIQKTVGQLSFSGIEHLTKNTSYLFLSNHRDIVLDPVLMNYVLHINHLATVYVAIGDNLLQLPFVNDLMRLNKSFIVKRSITGLREKVHELKRLSAYINYLIGNHCSVWLANREGRAKDGLDTADPAIIKMLYLSQKDSKGFMQTMQELNIVPVVIAYEYDPCDALKAQELMITSQQGRYLKEKDEDMISITRGIMGYKGGVHVHFGKPITSEADLASPSALAEALDRVITANYRLYPSNYIAYQQLSGEPSAKLLAEKYKIDPSNFIDSNFLTRLNSIPESLRQQVLQIYANPVIQKYHHQIG